MSYTAEQPIQYTPDPSKLGALAGGKVWFGVPNGNPASVPGDRIQVYLARQGLSDLAIAQPIDIGPGGVWYYQGSPAQIKVLVPYSVQVMNSLGVQKYYAPLSGDEILAFQNMQSDIDNITASLNERILIVDNFAALASAAVQIGDQVSTLGHTVSGVGGAVYSVVSPTGLISDGGYILVDGPIAFVAQGIENFPITLFGAQPGGLVDAISAINLAKAKTAYPFVPAGTFLVSTLDNCHGLWGDGSIKYNGVTYPLPKYPREDNFVIPDFTRYACAGTTWHPLILVGDSITEGSNAIDWKEDNYASIIKKAWQNKYGNNNLGFAPFDMVVYDNIPSSTKYPHYVTRSGFSIYYAFKDDYFGGCAIRSNTIGEWVETTFTGKDTVIVYEQDSSNGSILEVFLDGVSVGTIDTKAASTNFLSGPVAKASFSIPITAANYGLHTIRLVNTQAKTATLCGAVYLEDSANIAPLVFNCGRSSISLSDIPNNILDIYAGSTGLSVLALGVNDQLNSKPLATFKSKIEYFLSRVTTVEGKCILLDFMFSLPESNAYKTALRDRAWVYGYPFADIGKQWLQGTTENQFLSYLDADGIHPTTPGQAYIACEALRMMAMPYTKGTAAAGTFAIPIKQPALVADWAEFNASYDTAKYARGPGGVVTLSGTIKTTTGKAAYSTIFTISEASARPEKTLIFNCNMNHLSTEIEVHPTGEVKVGNTAIPAGGFLSLSGISYMT